MSKHIVGATIILVLILAMQSSAALADTVTYAFNSQTIWTTEETEYDPPSTQQNWVDTYDLVKVSGDSTAPATNGTVVIALNVMEGELEYISLSSPATSGSTTTAFNPMFNDSASTTTIPALVDWSLAFSSLPSAPTGYAFDHFTLRYGGEGVNSWEVTADFASLPSTTGSQSMLGDWPTLLTIDPWQGETADPGSSRSSLLRVSVVYASVPEPSSSALIFSLAALLLLRRLRSQ